MDRKFFDIPFRNRTPDSDFHCPDGEISDISNARIICSDGEMLDADSFLNQGELWTSETVPVPQISFALLRDILPGWHANYNIYPSKTLIASQPSMEYWTSLAGQLLERFQSEATLENLFVSPFYATAAWRMSDGTLRAPAEGTLLIPNSDVPLVATEGSPEAEELEIRVAGAVCRLLVKMPLQEVLRDWVGRIKSLEILVSSPLQRYETLTSFIPERRATTAAFCESLDLDSGEISRRRICSDILPLAWKAYVRGTSNWDSSEGFEERKFYRFASIPLGEIDLLKDWKTPGVTGPGEIVFGLNNKGVAYSVLQEPGKGAMKSKTVTVEGIGEEMRLVTRPLKLSGAGELKVARKLFLRGNYDPSSISIAVSASREMLHWQTISKRKGGTMAMLPCSPFRFYRLEVSGRLAPGETLEGFTL